PAIHSGGPGSGQPWLTLGACGGATAPNTPTGPTATATKTNTPAPPTTTPTRTNTPGATATPTKTNTPVPPTNTPTKTNTPVGPTATNTPTNTVPPTNTPTSTNTPVPATATPTPVTGTIAVDDSVQGTGQNQFNYAGSGWTHCTNSNEGGAAIFYNASQSYDITTNDSVTIAFTGTQIKYYAVKATDVGIAA